MYDEGFYPSSSPMLFIQINSEVSGVWFPVIGLMTFYLFCSRLIAINMITSGEVWPNKRRHPGEFSAQGKQVPLMLTLLEREETVLC